MKILDLPNYVIESTQNDGPDRCIKVRLLAPHPYCPKCSKKANKHITKTQFFMDLPIHSKRVALKVDRVKYRCKACRVTFLDPIPHMDSNHRMTRRLVEYIEDQSLNRTFTDIASEVGVVEGTIRTIFNAHIERCESEFRFVTPNVVGIDEIHLLHRFRAIITNIEKSTIIEVLKDRQPKSVTAFLKTLDKDLITCVTTDMWRGYHTACKRALPGIPVVIDKFHVLRMANFALDTIRKQCGKDLPQKKRTLLRSRHVLLKRVKKLTLRQEFRLNQIKNTFPELEAAHTAKEDFYSIYDSTDRNVAETLYDEWLKSLDDNLKAVFKELITSCKNWNEPIFNYFDYRYTNATTEALNGLSRKIEGDGRGYSFKAIRAKMMYNKKSHKIDRFKKDKFNKPVNYGVNVLQSHVKDIARIMKSSNSTPDLISKLNKNYPKSTRNYD